MMMSGEKISRLFNKINKRIGNLRTYETYTIGSVETSWFPKTTDFQRVWLNDENYITIRYVNWEKIDWSKEDYIFQSLNDENPTRIEIEFKKKDLILGLQLMIAQIDKSIGDEGDDMILFNEIKLPIRQAAERDTEENSLDGLFVMLDDEDGLVNIISENIRETNIIKLIFRDSKTYNFVSCIMYHFENYYLDEYYLYEKEYTRIKKILLEKDPNWFKD